MSSQSSSPPLEALASILQDQDFRNLDISEQLERLNEEFIRLRREEDALDSPPSPQWIAPPPEAGEPTLADMPDWLLIRMYQLLTPKYRVWLSTTCKALRKVFSCHLVTKAKLSVEVAPTKVEVQRPAEYLANFSDDEYSSDAIDFEESVQKFVADLKEERENSLSFSHTGDILESCYSYNSDDDSEQEENLYAEAREQINLFRLSNGRKTRRGKPRKLFRKEGHLKVCMPGQHADHTLEEYQVAEILPALTSEKFPEVRSVAVQCKEWKVKDYEMMKGTPLSVDLSQLHLSSTLQQLKVKNVLLSRPAAGNMSKINKSEFSMLAHLTALTSLSLYMLPKVKTSFNSDGSLGALSVLQGLADLEIAPLDSEAGLGKLTTLTRLSFQAMQRPPFPFCQCTSNPWDEECFCSDRSDGWSSLAPFFEKDVAVIHYGHEIAQLSCLQELFVDLGYREINHMFSGVPSDVDGVQDPNALCNRFQIPATNALMSLKEICITGYAHATSCTGDGTSGPWDESTYGPPSGVPSRSAEEETAEEAALVGEAASTAGAGTGGGHHDGGMSEAEGASHRMTDPTDISSSFGGSEYINLRYHTQTDEIIASLLQRIPTLETVRLHPGDAIPATQLPLGDITHWMQGALDKAGLGQGKSYKAQLIGEREWGKVEVLVKVTK